MDPSYRLNVSRQSLCARIGDHQKLALGFQNWSLVATLWQFACFFSFISFLCAILLALLATAATCSTRAKAFDLFDWMQIF
jgi:hypothetical protein